MMRIISGLLYSSFLAARNDWTPARKKYTNATVVMTWENTAQGRSASPRIKSSPFAISIGASPRTPAKATKRAKCITWCLMFSLLASFATTKKINPKIASLSLILNIEGIFWFNLYDTKSVKASSYMNTISDSILNAYTIDKG